MTDQDLIAKFLAEKGATQVGAGLAYGVNAEADKAKRIAQREANREVAHDRYMEQAHDAFFTGDRDEGYRLLSRARSV